MSQVRVSYLKLVLMVFCMTVVLSFSFAEATYPVVESFTGPVPGSVDFNNMESNLHYAVTVVGGVKPYHYKWMTGANVLAEGDGDSFAAQDFLLKDVSWNGEANYLRVIITDAKGNAAAYVKEDGSTGNEFIYGINSAKVILYPTLPYKEAPRASEVKTPTSTPSEGQFATFSLISGEVKIRPGDQENGWGFAKMNSKLYSEYHVLTGDDSSAIIGFSDLSVFKMDPNTEVIISLPSQSMSKLGLVGGTIWVNFKKMLKDGSMQVDLSQAVAGIKGTTFVCSELGGYSTLKVIEGTVEYTSKINNGVDMVGAGEMVQANYNGLNPKTTFDAVEESKHWDQMEASKFAGKNIMVYAGIAVIVSLGGFVYILRKRVGKKR